MPYSRPTLTTLRNQIQTDIVTAVSLLVSLLQKAVLKIVGAALAGLVFGLYGYLDWIARMAVPFTAEDEYLAAWGAMKGVFLKDATPAVLQAQFPGSTGTPLEAGTLVARSDGFTYSVVATESVDGTGFVTVGITALTTGSAGNCDDGTAIVLSAAVPGIQSNGLITETTSSGADVEEQDEFRGRVMQAFQDPVQGGDKSDYVTWAEEVPGVTRAWCAPNGFGAGTVVLYVMFDDAEASHAGFPQGTDGVSQFDEGPGGAPRDTPATGDQLVVADTIVVEQPVTALVYVCSPIENGIAFTIAGLSTASAATQASVSAAISDVFFREGQPGGTVDLSDINSAIGAVSGTGGYLITQITGTVNGTTTTYPPNTNITNSTGQLPVLINIVWA
jgi:uncharacterized phage protein gp47/JayE